MQDEKPAIIFENENIGRVSLRALNAITTRSSNAFQAGDPSG